MNTDLNQRVALRLGLAIIGEEVATVRANTLTEQLGKSLVENKKLTDELDAFKAEKATPPADVELP